MGIIPGNLSFEELMNFYEKLGFYPETDPDVDGLPQWFTIRFSKEEPYLIVKFYRNSTFTFYDERRMNAGKIEVAYSC